MEYFIINLIGKFNPTQSCVYFTCR